jgi:ribosomal protein S18 acetylase RimI-like enzyme
VVRDESDLHAFAADPVMRWVYPNPHHYLNHFPTLTRHFGAKAFGQGSAYYLEGFLGAALWLPPGVKFDEDAIVALAQRTVPQPQHPGLFAPFEQVVRHHPQQPHWYLVAIGVDPARQNQGQGSALMEHGLRACDQDHLPAYLESSNPRNISPYKKHGFEVLATLQAGKSPPVFPMLRPER